jgi:hypothetical protein
VQDAALQRQDALERGQAAALAMLQEAEGHVGGLFEVVEARAADAAAAATAQAHAQRQLAGELTGLLESSAGVRSALDVVLAYQRRSDSLLTRLLGRAYGLEDAAFYAAGAVAAWAAGASAATAKARHPRACQHGRVLDGWA